VSWIIAPASEIFFIVEHLESSEVDFGKGGVGDANIFIGYGISMSSETDIT
jgi:hypothetical protein